MLQSPEIGPLALADWAGLSGQQWSSPSRSLTALQRWLRGAAQQLGSAAMGYWDRPAFAPLPGQCNSAYLGWLLNGRESKQIQAFCTTGPPFPFLLCDFERELHFWSKALKEIHRAIPRLAVGIGCLWALKWRSLSSARLSKYYLCLKIWLMQLYFSGQMEKDRKEITFRASLSWGDSSLKCQHYWCIDIIKHVYRNVTAAAQRSDGRLWLGMFSNSTDKLLGRCGLHWCPLGSPVVECYWRQGGMVSLT